MKRRDGDFLRKIEKKTNGTIKDWKKNRQENVAKRFTKKSRKGNQRYYKRIETNRLEKRIVECSRQKNLDVQNLKECEKIKEKEGSFKDSMK